MSCTVADRERVREAAAEIRACDDVLGADALPPGAGPELGWSLEITRPPHSEARCSSDWLPTISSWPRPARVGVGTGRWRPSDPRRTLFGIHCREGSMSTYSFILL